MKTIAELSPLARMASLNIAQCTLKSRKAISPALSFLAGLVLAAALAAVLKGALW